MCDSARVRAVAVNPIDLKIRSGRLDGIIPVRFPVLPGWDVAGVVEAAGQGAGPGSGDEVFGPASVGGYSQYALLDHPVAKPDGLSWEAAASVISVGEAAFRVLKHLGLKAGQTLRILGAGGSVGTIAVQLAAARGITVIGTAAEGDLERLTGLGATAVRSADHGVRFTGADPADRAPEALPELAALMAAGRLDVPIWRTYPLAQAAQAHADLEARRNHGKIVLLP